MEHVCNVYATAYWHSSVGVVPADTKALVLAKATEGLGANTKIVTDSVWLL